jgi:hypothetical protein
MTEEANHIIRTQQYQIQLEDEKNAYGFQTKISQLQTSVVNNLLDRILSDYSEKGYLIQFNEIVLDLGTVNNTNWEKEIPYRIEEQLTRFLQSAILESGTLRTGKKIKVQYRDIELLEHFLLNGYAPWNYPVHKRPVTLFSKLIAKQDKSLSLLLKNIGKKETVRKRLIAQFDDTILENTVLAVTDNQQKYIIHYRQHITFFQKENKLIDTTESNFRNALWEIIFALLFTETNGYYNKKFFIKYTLQKIAQKYRLGYSILLAAISNPLSEYRQDIHSDLEFKKIIMELYKEDTYMKAFDKTNDAIESSDKFAFSEFEVLLNYFLKHESLPLNSGIHSTEDFLATIRKHTTVYQNVPDSLTELLYKVYDLLSSHSFLSKTSISNELFDSISVLQKKEGTSSEQYLNTVIGEHSFNVFLTKLNECIAHPTNPAFIRRALIEVIAQQASDIHLNKEVLIQKLITFLKRNLYTEKIKSISPDLLLYLYELVSENNIDPNVSKKTTDTNFFNENFTHIPLHRLLVQLSIIMFGNRDKSMTDTILFQYADEHGMNRTLLAQQLKTILYKERNQFPSGIFHKDLGHYLDERSDRQKYSADVTAASVNFSVDLLEYYAIYRKIPYWAKEVSLTQLSIHIQHLAQKAPNVLRTLLTENGAALLSIAPHADYLRMIRLLDDSNSLPEFVFQTHKLIEECISQKLVPVWVDAKKLRSTLRRIFAEEILRKSSMLRDKQKLMDFCIHEVEKALPFHTNDIADLLLEQRQYQNSGSIDDSEDLYTYTESISSVSIIQEEEETKWRIQELLYILDTIKNNEGISTSDAENSSKQILNYSKKYPDFFRQQLRTTGVRMTIIEKLPKRNLIQLLFLNTDDRAKKNIHASIVLLRRVRKFITGTQSDQVWKRYVSALLFKLSVDGNTGIREKEIAWMFYKSIEMTLHKSKTISIMNKLDAMQTFVPLKPIEKSLLKRIQSGIEKQTSSVTKESLTNKIRKIEKERTEKDLIGESIFVTGAGVVILGPFIPMLFTKLNFVTGSEFKDAASKAKAIQLLHYAVFGNLPFDETDTILFKLLCGMAPEEPLEIDNALSEEDGQLINGLLASIIQQWSILKSTSVEGLRETFLKREGKLQIEEEEYVLDVESKTYDMLLDHIPWSISKIKFSWMKKMILVQWR